MWRRPNGIRLVCVMEHRWVQVTIFISDLECSHHRFLLISSRDTEWSVTFSHRILYTSSWTQCYHTYVYLHRMYMASVASNMYPKRVRPDLVTRLPCSALSAWLPCYYKLILIPANIQNVRFRLQCRFARRQHRHSMWLTTGLPLRHTIIPLQWHICMPSSG